MAVDILGADWAAREIPLEADEEGAVIATLVHRPGRPKHRRAVLYIHGFVDYFFQTQMAENCERQGYDFYALDLRKYGRSLLPHQTPNYCTDLAVYDAELDEAVRIIRQERGAATLVVHAHSTGGLIAPLWLNRRPGTADALVLNSPWFDLNGSLFERTLGTWLLYLVGQGAPRMRVGKLADHYGKSLHVSSGGAWDYDLALKPLEGFPVRAGWIRAIRLGHRQLARGLHLDCPVLICTSSRSGPHDRWHDALDRTDSVLNVAHMAERAAGLARVVTLARIEDGIHDLALSAQPAHDAYFAEITRWTSAYVPPA